ncbi:DUF4350 domain-containing protein [Winogradskyella sp. 3972H.M.0a.05]|uniref:DUF4350 domain-containing protein n=1 Tax=Winogradskyella sp. 3972H.M.0a.05 TaxID=2950277 RepID=UPI003391FF0C
MSRKGKVYIILLILTVIVIVFLEMTKAKSVNWFPSYATHHKIPYGTYVFQDLLEKHSTTINNNERPPFEYLGSDASMDGTYLFINDNIYFGEDELYRLLDWVDDGNKLFISASDFEEKLLDTLNLNTRSINTFSNFSGDFELKLVNPNLDDRSVYTFEKDPVMFYFNRIDSVSTKVLGVIKNQDSESDIDEEELLANVIRQPFGDGEIILSTFPQAFTNYFILKDNGKDYTSDLMSYIDFDRPLYVDQYYKSGKTIYSSPMYLFLNTKSLKWAYYIVIIGALIYIIFEGKRKQRMIPIVQPLKNQTVDFTRTISNMYYENGKHKDIVHHKIQHFLEYIRNHWHLQTSIIDNTFVTNLASRSNNTIEDTTALFEAIKAIENQEEVSATRLERLNNLIENFKSNNQWKTKT